MAAPSFPAENLPEPTAGQLLNGGGYDDSDRRIRKIYNYYLDIPMIPDMTLEELRACLEEIKLQIGGGGVLDVSDYIGPLDDNPLNNPIMCAAVTAFLEELGYLKPIDGGGYHDVWSFQSAVERYQLNHNLDLTGIIDLPTASMMSSRLCGVPDIVDGMNLTRLHGGYASCLTLHSGNDPGNRSAISATYASVSPIAPRENQVKDLKLIGCGDIGSDCAQPSDEIVAVYTENILKLFGGDCAYTQSVGDFPVTAFLERTGYLQPIDSGGVHDVLSISSALKTYQLNHGLEDTGIIDDPTVSMMLNRRCGAPDIVDGLNLTRFHGGDASCFNLFPGGPKWENTNLTYHYYSSVPEAAKPAFKLAFAEWTRVRPEFTFTEVPAAGDIKISFCRGKHGSGDCLPFNGPGSVLAHSFAPCDGRLHVDESQFWSFRNIPNAAYFVDLESAVLHEIGHILGLTHSYDENAVMFPGLKPNEIKNRLTRDDIHGINFLYGKY